MSSGGVGPGTRVGPYEVLSLLGKGGMGEVWRARDPRLRREVALKLLPAGVASDPARLARFEREARLLASLNHPNIAAVYGLETAIDTPCLVLELVEGEDLADRLQRGPLPPTEAVAVARLIAGALEAAHEKAIVHRDLKPANVKLGADGRVKVLDFGLAKALDEPQPSDAGSSITTEVLTRGQAVLGTPAYMSPEQARGERLDRRTDVWSFGCVLFEMLAGHRPFAGTTSSDLVASILTTEPDWAGLPPDTPSLVRELLRRCLQKDPRRRLRDLGDAGLELEEAFDRTTPSAAGTPRGATAPGGGARWWKSVWMGLALGAAGTAAVMTSLPRRRPASPWFPKRLSVVVLPAALASHSALAFSPDGTRLVFEGTVDGRQMLVERSLGSLEVRPIPGTEGGTTPFFSPDGRWLGFEAGEKLRKLPVSGGDVLTLCEAPGLRGAAWANDGTIVFAPYTWDGLWQVSGDGGTPRALTHLDAGALESSHRWPVILPGGREVLFSILPVSGREEQRRLAVLSRDTGAIRTLEQGGNQPLYAASGHLLYARKSSIFAARFDLSSLRVTGEPVPLIEDVDTFPKGTGRAAYAVSSAGEVVYAPGSATPADHRLVWVDRGGHQEPLTDTKRPYHDPVVSPDGTRLAVSVEGESDEIWEMDLRSRQWTRLTFEGDNRAPVWSPDGAKVVFSSNRSGQWALYEVAANGEGSPRALGPGRNWMSPSSFSPDGRTIVVTDQNSRNLNDVLALSLSTGTFTPLAATPFDEGPGVVSRDGRWLAFASEESGRTEVYLRPLEGGPKLQVSRGGGTSPRWSPDGRELFYREGDAVLSVAVAQGSRLEASPPRILFRGDFELRAWYDAARDYDVAPDGRFVMVANLPQGSQPAQLVLIPDGFAEFLHRVTGER